jgi:hypothetical protein
VPHELLLKADRVVVNFSGVVEDDEFRETVAELRFILGKSPDLNEIVDLTGVERFAVTIATVLAVSETPPVFSDRSVQVIVAPDMFAFGTSRMYQMLVERSRPKLSVVRTLAEAEELLSLEPWPRRGLLLGCHWVLRQCDLASEHHENLAYLYRVEQYCVPTDAVFGETAVENVVEPFDATLEARFRASNDAAMTNNIHNRLLDRFERAVDIRVIDLPKWLLAV